VAVGYAELVDNMVVFVFPEHPDEDGNPRRVSWGEASEANLILQRLETPDRCHARPLSPSA